VTFAALALAALVAAWWFKLVTWEQHVGYYGPAFSPEGRHVYAIVREAAGFTWGFGWEHFTPPAHAYLHTDRVRLVRIDAATGNMETLETWVASPLVGRFVNEYRGRIFNIMRAAVRVDPTAVRYEIEIAIPVVPASEVHRVSGTWSPQPDASKRGEWQRGGHGASGLSEPVVAGHVEVFALNGPESFPCAVVLLDHASRKSRVLSGSKTCHGLHPDGPPVGTLFEASRKKDLDRLTEMERIRNETVSQSMSQGASKIQALLESNRVLEDKGYLPRSPRLVAHKTPATDTVGQPVFSIADAEMASGIFADIEKAIGAPGTEIDKAMGKYIVHDHYTNSAALNAHLAAGARAFFVRYRGEIYRLELRYAR
jgi:hypothetical protein